MKGKRKLKKIDIFDEIDTRGVELFEFVKTQFPYSEQELKDKPIHIFFDIVDRANKKVEAANASKPKKGK